jgi:demethylmenaquinone methyltransferase/2-methoxy-6-polyprenyl-1,4-benzoquinol methylase
LVRGDALRLPFKNATFEIVTISYGLRNLSDFDAAIAELLRVTKPGGRVLILDFGKPDNVLWRWLYFTYLRMGVPLFGLAFCRDAAAYGYILESLQHYPAQHGVDQALRKLNCRNVCIHNFLGGAMSINYAER